MAIEDKIRNKFLLNHLAYVKNTESPKIFHLWSALAGASACLGQHVWTDMKIKKIFPNDYFILVGPPATRKNTAINAVFNLVMKSTGVKLAPDDTGGKHQGLISAIEESEENKIDDDTRDLFDIPSIQRSLNPTLSLVSGTQGSNRGLQGIAMGIESIGLVPVEIKKDNLDQYTLFVKATEFGTFLSQGSQDLIRFLIKMWDCEPYNYKLKKEKMTLKNACVGIFAGTTTADLAKLLPPDAIDQGFMSRVVLIYAPKRAKAIPPSAVKLDKKYEPDLISTYKYLYYTIKGEMKKTPEAIRLEDKIYLKDIKLTDSRFIYYSARRGDHLIKIAMVLAATSMRNTIEADDLLQAHEILIETEKFMPDALGEYGLSPIVKARQKMLEFLRHANTAVAIELLWYSLQNDMTKADFIGCVDELVTSKKITSTEVHGKGVVLIYNELQEDAKAFL